MIKLFKSIADDRRFNNFITWTIVFAGLIIGLETSPEIIESYGEIFHIFDICILSIFVLEIIIKVGAEGRRPWRYFFEPWNIFDFAIVAVCFLPINAQFAAVLRLARLFRVLKLVRALPKLQILVSALLKSLPSMGYVGLLLGLLFYIYSVAGVFLFGGNDPLHFGNIWIAMLSLFRVVTGEDWTDVMYIQMYGCEQYSLGEFAYLCTDPVSYPVFGALFFVSFMFLGSLIIMNLFIGVIMNGMEEAQQENERERHLELEEPTKSVNISNVLLQLENIQKELQTLKYLSEQQEELDRSEQ